jgi:adenylosuccinate lyase
VLDKPERKGGKMIKRYRKSDISRIWDNANKYNLWDKTELALLKAYAKLRLIAWSIFWEIEAAWKRNPPDENNIDKQEKITKHDLNSYLSDRVRWLSEKVKQYVHKRITSYDTEESAFIKMILESIEIVFARWENLEDVLIKMAQKYRYTIMNGRTHGQEAELQTHGKRTLTWIADLRLDFDNLKRTMLKLVFSKLSGAIGNYGNIDPEIEKETLSELGFSPYYGATQIMPREIYAPVAQALCQITQTLDKIATAIRLGARSGSLIYQEPFSKLQKGSSAMPHKRNPIGLEQIEGMARIAKGLLIMIMDNIKTWEERAIEQSCVERVAWPDLFHAVVHTLEVMTRILDGLNVYADNMLLEIHESRGCYASAEVKEFLKEKGFSYGLSSEDAYRIVQLAAFNAFDPQTEMKELRNNAAISLDEADQRLANFGKIPLPKIISIKEIIAEGELFFMPDQLDISETKAEQWNNILRKIFSDPDTLSEWHMQFQPSHLLRHEAVLYKEILGI